MYAIINGQSRWPGELTTEKQINSNNLNQIDNMSDGQKFKANELRFKFKIKTEEKYIDSN